MIESWHPVVGLLKRRSRPDKPTPDPDPADTPDLVDDLVEDLV